MSTTASGLQLGPSMIVTSRIGEEATSLAALGVWQLVWSELERLVAETREMLGSHLRHAEIAARRLAGDGEREVGELVIGRTRLQIECPLACWPARREEPLFRDAFGADAPLVRIFVHRLRSAGPPRLAFLFAADPSTGVWVSTDPDLGPALLNDLGSLERFFWSVIADQGSD